jgi:hypothetical protein
MIATCPHCQKKLKLSAKTEEGIKQLAPGKSVRLACPQCGGAISLDATMVSADASSAQTASPSLPQPTGQKVTPPPPPDLSRISVSQAEGKSTVEDVPKALIMMPSSSDYYLVANAMEAMGYQCSFLQSAEEAMEKMQFINYDSVTLYCQYKNSALDKSVFHQFMQAMTMNKRRHIFYTLIGPDFHTLYDLEAMACSANLVVNEQDLPQLAIILRTAIPLYEAMFGTMIAESTVMGR